MLHFTHSAAFVGLAFRPDRRRWPLVLLPRRDEEWKVGPVRSDFQGPDVCVRWNPWVRPIGSLPAMTNSNNAREEGQKRRGEGVTFSPKWYPILDKSALGV